MVRLATLGNSLPGLLEAGQMAVTQRAAGANQSVDIAAGSCLVDPRAATHQGVYLARLAASFNTLADGGLTWTTSDPTNPRIDLLCVEVADQDFSGSYTGFKFRVVDGTPNASAAHQLDAQYWPAIPTGLVPIAAVRRPATSTTITTAMISNLNPVGGGRAAGLYTTAAETTTSTTYTRLATPDALLVYVPSSTSRVRLFIEAHWKISVASGTQGVTVYVDGAQLKYRNATNGAPAVGGCESTLATVYARITSSSIQSNSGATNQFFAAAAGSGSDVSDITTGIAGNPTGTNAAHLEIGQLASGWHLVEARFKTSANTLTVRERRMSAEVIG